MPDQYNFNVFDSGGPYERPTVACIEIGCDAKGFAFEWPEEKRKEHFLTHYKEPVEVTRDETGNVTIYRGDTREDVCVDCGETFEQPRRRGRPRVKCYTCKPEKE